jgi:hypothetical protein
MKSSRKRVRCWHVDDDGFDAIEPGVKKSYKGAQRAMIVASNAPSPEAIHEWRKRVKDHWYHSRLLSEIWPRPMKAHCEVADQLGDMLGKHHDLEVFGQKLAAEDFGDRTEPGGTDGLGPAPTEDDRGGSAFDWGSAIRRVPRKLDAPVAILLGCLAPEARAKRC